MRWMPLLFTFMLTACDQKTLSCTEDLSAVQECDSEDNCEIVEDCASEDQECYPNMYDLSADPYCMETATLEE